MANVFLAPDPVQSTQFLPGSNTPASGALIFVYSEGTTTKMNSYTDVSASTANTNPIVLNSGGNPPQQIWIASTAKFVLAPANDTDPPSSPYRTWDHYPAMNNVAALIASSVTGEWVQGSTATFVGVTAFSLVGDQTALYTLGRRIKAAVTGGDRFGNVTSAVVAGASTAVGVTLDSSTLNAGLSSVSYGFLGTPNGSIPWTQITSNGLFFEVPVTTGTLSASTTNINGTLSVSSSVSTASLLGLTSITSPGTINVSADILALSSTSKSIRFVASSAIISTDAVNLNLNVAGGAVQASQFNALTSVLATTLFTARNGSPVSSGGVVAINFGNAPLLGIYFGSGVPTATGNQGSLYIRTDGTNTSNRVYVAATNTSWTAIITLT